MYADTTFASASTQLGQLLGDPTGIYWTDAERKVYIREALRTWGSMSLYWRERGTFSTSSGVPFYALQALMPSLLGYTVTDTEVARDIQYALLEPPSGVPDGATWNGTPMFTLADLTAAIQRRRNQFLVDTGAVLRHSTQVIAPPADGRIAIADTIIDVRRAAYKAVTDTTWTTLWREDEWSIGASTAMSWAQNPGPPQLYSILAPPPITLQLAPPPSVNGTLSLVTTDSGPALNPASGVILGIPDDFAWVIKMGALADLLGADGPARDEMRSDYCEQRWDEGIQLARIYASVVQLQVNNVPVYVIALQELDSSNPTWESTAGQPVLGALAGLNLIALAGDGSIGGVPDGAYGMSADVVRRAPVPTADGDFLQLGQEELDAVLRYAQHLACFKEGGQEFIDTKTCYEGLMKAASVYNDRLKANAKNFDVLKDRARLEQERRPRRMEMAPQ